MRALAPQQSATHLSARAVRIWAALAGMLLLAGRPALAQNNNGEETEAFCSVVSVKSEQLSNAARVTVNADGVMMAKGDYSDFFEQVGADDWRRRRGTRFPIRLVNAKSKIGSFVDVGVYPISHLEFTIPPDAPRGVGLEMTVVLLARGEARRIRLYHWGMGGSQRVEGVALDMRLTRSRRSLIITAWSDRYVDLDLIRKGKARQIPHECRCDVNTDGRLLWVNALNTPSSEVFRDISRCTGLKIIQSDVVDRRVSAYLPGMSVEDAMAALGRAYGLCIEPVDGAYIVTDSAAPSSSAYLGAETRAIPVRNIQAEAAMDMLPNFLTRYAHAEPSRNVIVATGSEDMLDKLESDIQAIDVPAPRIEVRAIAVEAADLRDMEASLGLRSADGTTEWTSDSASSDVTFHVAPDLPEDVEARLRALEQRESFELVSKARAVTGNGERAQLFVGDTHFFTFRTARRRGQEVVLSQTDVGVRLFVRPVTGGQGEIASFMYLRVGSIVSVDDQGLPLISTRRVRATVLSRDGETIYIGGISSEQRSRIRRKVPVLGDIPLVGGLFRKWATRTTRSRLGLFVTLHVLTDEETQDALPALQTQASVSTTPGG